MHFAFLQFECDSSIPCQIALAPALYQKPSAKAALNIGVKKVEMQSPQPFLRFLFYAILPIELLNTSVSSGHFLLASVERMAFGANFYMNLGLRGAGHKSVAAVTSHGCLIVLRMDSFLHLIHLFIIDSQLRNFIGKILPLECFSSILFPVHIRTAYGTTNSAIIVAYRVWSCKSYFK